ncbi:uncharacterized protein IUM83_16385 [Phytophthora cinnamomi]|uniref:uncharacterized protein n=1 Tax=Phytophthora cinnamomi TaxID=4785 RepID=UPI00355AB562|nr:hypothetical protein IUM83_16385 [Phytophthora cinnamomi]
MPAELERDLAEWIAAMQWCGMPVGRRDIIAKASAMLARHPFLSNRIAQCIARVRNAVDEDGVATLFYTLAKLFIELKIDAAHIFNMDETSFMLKTARRKFVAVRGSANVWRKETKPSFHVTVVGAVSANGATVPPLVVVPGVRVFKEDIAALNIKGATITGAPKGFSNTKVFVQWLAFFGDSTAHLPKPVVLIVDISATHIAPEAAEICVEYGNMLVALPANATHLLQPLDVALFKSYKDCVHNLMLERLAPSAIL